MISKELKNQIQKFKDQVLSAKNIVIVAHQNPDGDAVGASLALRILLKEMGKANVEVALMDTPPAYLSYLPYFFTIKDNFHPLDFDMAILVDCGGWKRTGFFDDNHLNIDWPEHLTIIDHHYSQETSDGIKIINSAMSSASELIYYIFAEWGIDINKDAAECLLTGISFDTGSFMHSNTTAEILEIAAKLVEKGANIARISQNMFGSNSLPKLKLWGMALNKMKTNGELGLVYSFITNEELTECGATFEDLEGVVNLINSIPEMRAALLLSERGEELKGSLRTEAGDVDVSKLAAIFGGGGHIKAAGFTTNVEQ